MSSQEVEAAKKVATMNRKHDAWDDICKPVHLRLADPELYNSVKETNFEHIGKCISFGANVNCHREDKITPLHYAAENGNDQLATFLLRQPEINVNLQTTLGHTALYIAVQLRHKKVVDTLLRHGAKTGIGDTLGRTPLHIAVFQSHKDLIELLVRSGASVNLKDTLGDSPLDAAVLRLNSTIITRFLLNHGGVPDSNLLHKAVLQANFQSGRDVARMLVHHGVNVNEQSEIGGCTPLHYAVVAGNLEMAQMLLKSGADRNVVAFSGQTPLNMATIYRNETMVNLLIGSE